VPKVKKESRFCFLSRDELILEYPIWVRICMYTDVVKIVAAFGNPIVSFIDKNER